MQNDPTESVQPIVVLGAGINGAALARELVLNRVPVWLIDRADVASGTTAYSSRLIHGGLRYLEYGEFDLVRESLRERTRLLRLAPQFVKPLRLYIPVSHRWGGLWTSAKRFLGLDRGQGISKGSRGLWWVRLGLWMYDMYAQDPTLPRHRAEKTGRSGDGFQPHLKSSGYPWVCSYYDAQIAFPERFTLALVEDAIRISRDQGTEFRLLTYRHCRLVGRELRVMRSDPESPFADDLSDVSELNVEPRLIVNATGAWVDETLRSLKVSEKELLQGTKGTHLFTLADRLREALRGAAIYGEAADGRPAFILPLGSGTLIGTTDDRFSGAPESAVATEQEIDYLIGLVNTLVPDVDLTREDICWHYAGVRPLPKGNNGATGSITRRHFLVENPQAPVPMYSLVGGKLTTCRSLAEEATKKILEGLGQAVVAGSRDRVFPGGEGYPADEVELKNRIEEISAKSGFTCEQTLAVWSLVGTQADRILTSLSAEEQTGLPGTELPMSFVKWIIRNEYVTTLNDLVERRLMLMFNSPPTRETLQSLAELLVQEGILKPEQSADEVLKTEQRLMGHMGYSIHYSPPTA